MSDSCLNKYDKRATKPHMTLILFLGTSISYRICAYNIIIMPKIVIRLLYIAV